MTRLPVKQINPVRDVFISLNDIMIVLTRAIMALAPIGVFALIVPVIYQTGGGIFLNLGKYFLAVLLALGLVACDSADAPAYPSDSRTGETSLALGQTATLDGLTVTFSDVVTDSRCPTNAECVWAGEAVVTVALGGATRDLRVADPEARPEDGVRIGNLIVFAIALTPEPRADAPVDVPPTLTLAAYPAP